MNDAENSRYITVQVRYLVAESLIDGSITPMSTGFRSTDSVEKIVRNYKDPIRSFKVSVWGATREFVEQTIKEINHE